MKRILPATAIVLTTEERATLEAFARSGRNEARMRNRARIALLAAEGTPTREIGRLVGCTMGTASKWRVRYARDRLAGLDETGRRGARPVYGPEHGKRILSLLDQPPPDGYGVWTAPLLARSLEDIHEQYIWRFLRAQKIDLSGRKSWCESSDPDFVAKAAEIVGSTWRRRTTPWCSPSTRSRRSRRWSARRVSEAAARSFDNRPVARLHPPRHDDAVRRPRRGNLAGDGPSLQTTPAHRVP